MLYISRDGLQSLNIIYPILYIYGNCSSPLPQPTQHDRYIASIPASERKQQLLQFTLITLAGSEFSSHKIPGKVRRRYSGVTD